MRLECSELAQITLAKGAAEAAPDMHKSRFATAQTLLCAVLLSMTSCGRIRDPWDVTTCLMCVRRDKPGIARE